MRTVYLSADDFGRSRERNIAIDQAFRKGYIKSAGLIVTGQYLQGAISLINDGGYVNNVHCHFNVSGNIKGEDSNDRPLTVRMKRDPFFCSNGLFHSYGGKHFKIRDFIKWHVIYKELCAQYNKFKEVTDNKGNLYHVDFHLWYNLNPPVALAFNLFTWTHRIKSARFIGVHNASIKRQLLRWLLGNPFVKVYKSGTIDFYIYKPDAFKNNRIIELYCHPDIISGELVDNTYSTFGKGKRSLEDQILLLRNHDDIVLASWADE